MVSLVFALLVGSAAGHGGAAWEGHGHHHGGGHGFMKKLFREHHACHERCGDDIGCHDKCPKPWEPIVKSCEEFPTIKKCYDACKTSQDKGCLKSCPQFSVDWIEVRFDQNPEFAMMIGEKKCPEVQKIHACHQTCKPGDHECHHKCGHVFGHHGFGHHGFHHLEDEAHACHEKCGDDHDCHKKCPKPWEPMVKSCEEFPAIKKCYEACKKSDKPDCLKSCPSFSVDWIKAKFERNPERAMKKGERKCPEVLKVHECHQTCKPDDHGCHHKCGSVFEHGDHHGFEHGEHNFGGWGNHHGQRDREIFAGEAEPVGLPAKEVPPTLSRLQRIFIRAEKLFDILYDMLMSMTSDFSKRMSYKQEVIHV